MPPMRFNATQSVTKGAGIVLLLLLPLLLAAGRPALGDERRAAGDLKTGAVERDRRVPGPDSEANDPSAPPSVHREPGRGRQDGPLVEGPPQVAAGVTSLTMDSEPGDYIGGGQHQFYTPAEGTFSLGGNRNHVSISFSSSSHFWN